MKLEFSLADLYGGSHCLVRLIIIQKAPKRGRVVTNFEDVKPTWIRAIDPETEDVQVFRLDDPPLFQNGQRVVYGSFGGNTNESKAEQASAEPSPMEIDT